MKCLCYAALTQKEKGLQTLLVLQNRSRRSPDSIFLCFSEKNLDDEETKLEQKTNRGRVQTMPADMKEERI